MCVFESKKYLGRTHGIFSREEQLQFEETALLNGIKWGKTECRRATCKSTLKWALHGTLDHDLTGKISQVHMQFMWVLDITTRLLME